MLQLTPKAIDYAIAQLLKRAGASSEALPLRISYGARFPSPSDHKQVHIQPCSASSWDELLAQPPESLTWLPLASVIPDKCDLDIPSPIPVLFWGGAAEEDNRPFAEMRTHDQVVFYADVIAATFFMLSRWEETVIPDRDEHSRFPAAASVAYRQGFLDRPIVDEYALILRAWIRTLLPGWQPQEQAFSIQLSHDIDHIQYPDDWAMGCRNIASSLIRRHDWRRAKQHWIGLWTKTFAPTQSPYLKGIQTLADLSLHHGIHTDVFNFMAAEPGPFDCGYDITSPLVRSQIRDLEVLGFHIGFHPSYRSFDDADRFLQEKSNLEAMLKTSLSGGRQHYLRFRVPDTWRMWEKAGLNYDSTMGFPECGGFRCGTCHTYRPFDVEEDREMDLWERPLIMMDVTLTNYNSFTPDQGERIMAKLLQKCRNVGGVFTLLWHNSSLIGGWSPWVDVYRRFLAYHKASFAS